MLRRHCSRSVRFACFLVLLSVLPGCTAQKDEKKAPAPPPAETETGGEPVGAEQPPQPPPDAVPPDAVPPDAVPPDVEPHGTEKHLRPKVARMEMLTDDDHHVVEVFYATDRLPKNMAVPDGFLALYKWPMLAGVICFALLVLAFRTKHALRYGALALLAAAISLKTTQTAMLTSQRQSRAMDYGDRVYGSDRHEVAGVPVLEMGICEVSVPPDHRVGMVESPSVLRLEFREDPEKHVIVNRTIHKPEAEVMEELKACIAKSDAKQALVFIHGYNVSFDSAVKRTAQIAYDLEFDGAPICYSWPSQGGLEKYTYDEDSIRWTVPQLETFLNRVVAESGAKTVHLVAHSMGNRALVEVLERIYLQNKEDHYTFGQIIMAAPDVDSSSFRNRYVPILKEMSQRATLYASSNDRALKASTEIHGYTRAGLSGEHLLALVGVETVDVSPIDTSLIGHSYYGDNPVMIRDLHALIHENIPAAAREWLQEMLQEPNTLYWKFRDKLPDLDGANYAPEL